MSEEKAIMGLMDCLKDVKGMAEEQIINMNILFQWMDENLTEEQKFKFAMDNPLKLDKFGKQIG